MTIIKIVPHENGGHDNQTTNTPIPVPEGYAIIPEEVGTPETLPNFPFGEIKTDFFADNVPVVTSWTPLPIPEPEPQPEPESTLDEVVNAMLGV